MNSRQRRKLEAAAHNKLLEENAAYLEDSQRDPEKYRRKPSRKGALLPMVLGAMLSSQIKP